MITSPIEEKRKRRPQRRRIQHVGLQEMNWDPRRGCFAASLLQSQRTDVHGGHLETLLGQPDGIGPRATAQFQSPAWLNAFFFDSPNQFGRGGSCVPGYIARLVSLVPMRLFGHG